MCSSKDNNKVTTPTPAPVAKINGRPVLQPTCNRVPNLDRRNSLKKKSPPLPTFNPNNKAPLLSPRPQSIKRGNELNLSSEKVVTPTSSLERKKSKSFKEGGVLSCNVEAALSYSSTLIIESPGSIAAVRREQMALQHAQRKMRIAHYGRSKSANFESKVIDNNMPTNTSDEQEKRCSFITANSGN